MTLPIQEVDVMIVGSGSAGLAAATWLSIYGIKPASTDPSTPGGVCILEKRDGPMKMGQADGVQCRTVEIFESFGLSEKLLRDAYHVLEVSFWNDLADADGGEEMKGRHTGKLRRKRYTADTQKGLSWMPHVILNQARVNGMMLEKMRRERGYEVSYGWETTSVKLEEDGEWARVVAKRVDTSEERQWRARYVLGCDGAHSAVRRSLGYKMIGDATNAVWGVMDVYPLTKFPDIRKKATLHSEEGALLIIPREGGDLCRFYIELPEGTIAKDVKQEDLIKAAKKLFGQYSLEIRGTFWWSAYAIGQRLADKFSEGNRVFLTGDACHTHSPKAGQGMNTSLQDGYNMGWKLGMVLSGQSDPKLLKTYNLEREKVAADLIDFDRRWTQIFSVKNAKELEKNDPEYFSNAFIKAAKYTAGLTAKYGDSEVMSASQSRQDLAKNLVVGMRFPSAQVVRFCDAKVMQLSKALHADGRWRVVIFAGDLKKKHAENLLRKLGDYLDSQSGPVRRFTLEGADIDSLIEPIVVLHGDRHLMEQEQLHRYFWPATGKWKMVDLHKTFVDDESYNSGHGNAYKHYGVDPGEGAVAIVRPDLMVSKVMSLDDFEAIGSFFEQFLQKTRGGDQHLNGSVR